MMGAAGALPDKGAFGEDGVWGAETVVGAEDCWVSVELQNAAQAGLDDVEGKVLRALCRRQGTKTRVSEAWVEPQNGSSGAGKPEPGYCPLTWSDEGMQVEE